MPPRSPQNHGDLQLDPGERLALRQGMTAQFTNQPHDLALLTI